MTEVYPFCPQWRWMQLASMPPAAASAAGTTGVASAVSAALTAITTNLQSTLKVAGFAPPEAFSKAKKYLKDHLATIYVAKSAVPTNILRHHGSLVHDFTVVADVASHIFDDVRSFVCARAAGKAQASNTKNLQAADGVHLRRLFVAYVSLAQVPVREGAGRPGDCCLCLPDTPSPSPPHPTPTPPPPHPHTHHPC